LGKSIIIKKLILIVLLLSVFSCLKNKVIKNKNIYKKSIDSFESVDINGLKQWILIRSNDINKPILLYLHGGPGHSVIPFAHKATDKLLDHFIVVHWDQRGTGLSYSENIPDNTMNFDQFIDDTYQVVRYLINRFNKEKIYLLGHSWGSALGIMTINKYPDLFYKYIGVGQVINSKKQEEISKKWLINKIENEGTEQEINYLKNIWYADRGLLFKYGGIIHNLNREEIKNIRNCSPYFKEKYTDELFDKGLRLSLKNMYKEISQINFIKNTPKLKIPVYFFLGKYDYLTPTKLVLDYYAVLDVPYKEIIWFQKSGHRCDIEEPILFQEMIVKKLLN